MTRQEESVQLDMATPKPWRRWIPSWLRSLIWVDFADKYDAFLSYSWKADSKTASVIHSVLQGFLCPWYKLRAKTIFRDLSCMPAGSSLENELFDRMDRSTHLVVLACPEVARSVGMEMEARHWFSRPREGQVLIILTAGEFKSWDDIRERALPAAVQNVLASEPLWISLQHRRAEILATPNRQMLRGQLIEDLKQIFLRLHAPRTWEELQGEERAQRRRALFVVSVAALLLLGLATVAVWFARRAQMETAIAEENARESRARELAAYATVSLNEDPERSILLGMHAVSATVRFGLPPIPAAEEALHQALLASVRLTLRHSDSVSSISWSPTLKFLATGSKDGVATVWDIETGKELMTFGGRKDSVNSVSWSPNGKLLAVGANSGTTTVWDTETGMEPVTFGGRKDSVNSVSWSPTGKLLAVGTNSGTTTVWDTKTSKELLTFDGRKDSVNSVSWSPSGKLLAVGANSGKTTVWDAETGGAALILPSDGFPVLSVAWSPNGRRLAIGSSWTATVWDAEHAIKLQTLEGHLGDVYSVAWSGDGKWLATGSYDQSARIWDPENGEELSSLSDHHGSVRSVAWGPAERLATGGEDRTVKVWDSRKKCAWGTESLTLRGHRKGVVSVAWRFDGEQLATGSWDGTAKVWDAKTGRELRTLSGDGGQVGSVVWSPDGRLLATGGWGGATVWNPETGNGLLVLPVRKVPSSVAWSPSDKRLATGSWDGTAEIWDAETGKKILTLEGHRDNVNELAWDLNGKRLATASWDGTAKVWDTKTGKQLMTLSGHRGQVYRVAWSPDGKLLATGGWDETAKVWNPETGQVLMTLIGHRGFVGGVAWSPNGKRLASASLDGTVQVYAMDRHQLMELARRRVKNVSLTPGECKLYFQSEACPPLP